MVFFVNSNQKTDILVRSHNVYNIFSWQLTIWRGLTTKDFWSAGRKKYNRDDNSIEIPRSDTMYFLLIYYVCR